MRALFICVLPSQSEPRKAMQALRQLPSPKKFKNRQTENSDCRFSLGKNI